MEIGERVRLAIEARVPLVHPAMPEARGLLYVQFYEPARRPDARYRNAVVVAPAGLDRSPCGTGTSARLANLHARGRLGVGEAFGHESIIGTLFTGRIAGLTDVAGTAAVVPGDHRARVDDRAGDPRARPQRPVPGRLPALTARRRGPFC